jgi:hypothetical protein
MSLVFARLFGSGFAGLGYDKRAPANAAQLSQRGGRALHATRSQSLGRRHSVQETLHLVAP